MNPMRITFNRPTRAYRCINPGALQLIQETVSTGLRDCKGRIICYNDCVLCKFMHGHEFQGTVLRRKFPPLSDLESDTLGLDRSILCVVDQDGDYWDVEADRLEII